MLKGLGTPIKSLPIWYMGSSLTWKRMAITDWQPMVEEVEIHLNGWQTKVMSKRGVA